MTRIGIMIGAVLALALPAAGLDFYFDPDTLQGNTGQQVTLSGRITSSDWMRSFTVYLAYDTNVIDLVPPPLAGAVIAGHSGLQFNYFDHAPIHPTLLEVTGTIFGSDLWQGPGELFSLTFELRDCADAPVTAPFAPFFLDGAGSVVPVTFSPALVGVCPRVPRSPPDLVIRHAAGPQVVLRWRVTRLDTLDRPLFDAPVYHLLGQRILPSLGAESVVLMTADTTAIHAAVDESWNYRVIAVTP